MRAPTPQCPLHPDVEQGLIRSIVDYQSSLRVTRDIKNEVLHHIGSTSIWDEKSDLGRKTESGMNSQTVRGRKGGMGGIEYGRK
jgi:hypothetical protein